MWLTLQVNIGQNSDFIAVLWVSDIKKFKRCSRCNCVIGYCWKLLLKSILSYRIALFKVLSENGKNLQEFEESAGICTFREYFIYDVRVSFTFQTLAFKIYNLFFRSLSVGMDAVCCQYRETWGISETPGPRYKVQCCILGWGGGGRTGQVRTVHSTCTYKCFVCIDQSADYDSFSVLSLIRERTLTISIENKKIHEDMLLSSSLNSWF